MGDFAIQNNPVNKLFPPPQASDISYHPLHPSLLLHPDLAILSNNLSETIAEEEESTVKSASHVTELERIERFILSILPLLQGSIFLSVLAGVFIFYGAVVFISVLVIVVSIWM